MEDPVDIYTAEYLKEKINKDGYDFIAVLDDKPIGFCSIYNIKDGAGEISILIGDKKIRGKGYGEEMLEELCNYGFRIYRLKELFASVDERNMASLRAFYHLGFNEVVRKNGFVLLKREESSIKYTCELIKPYSNIQHSA